MTLSERINNANTAPWVLEEIHKLEAERDALAAHVELLVEFGDALRASNENGCAEVIAWDLEVEAAPTTSLARLKAQWQAEALESVVDGGREWGLTSVSFEGLKSFADILRRQAEEAE